MAGTQNGAGARLAVITGASSGIGLELAKVFGEEGFDLLINAEDDELADAEAELRADGHDVKAVRADLARPQGVEQLYEAYEAHGLTMDDFLGTRYQRIRTVRARIEAGEMDGSLRFLTPALAVRA